MVLRAGRGDLTLDDKYLTLYDMPLIRAAGISGFDALVRELGGDPAEMARRARLPLEALRDDELLVDDGALGRVLEIAATDLGVPDLGLRIAERQDFGMLGTLAVAIQNSPTIGDALDCTSRYLFVHARGLGVEAIEDPRGARGVTAIRYGPPVGGSLFPQGMDTGLGFLHRSTLFLASGSYGLRGVELPHRPIAPMSRYEEFFGAPVRFGAPAALLRVPSSLSAQPLRAVNQAVRDLALAHLDRQSRLPGDEAGPQVRSTLEQSLGTVGVEIDTVASLLNIHPRTLQRRLEAEGTSFAEILDRLRATTARTYLTTTQMPMSQVAAALGLSEQSALSRCCRRWWGRTPSDVRRRGFTEGERHPR